MQQCFYVGEKSFWGNSLKFSYQYFCRKIELKVLHIDTLLTWLRKSRTKKIMKLSSLIKNILQQVKKQ